MPQHQQQLCDEEITVKVDGEATDRPADAQERAGLEASDIHPSTSSTNEPVSPRTQNESTDKFPSEIREHDSATVRFRDTVQSVSVVESPSQMDVSMMRASMISTTSTLDGETLMCDYESDSQHSTLTRKYILTTLQRRASQPQKGAGTFRPGYAFYDFP
jgi:hypothetical protein